MYIIQDTYANQNQILCVNPDIYALQGTYRVFWILFCFSFVRRNLKSEINANVKNQLYQGGSGGLHL